VKKRRGGFTVLELVTVIGIIMVLMALLVVGVGHVIGSTKARQTKVMLENCRNLLAEFEVTIPLDRAQAQPSQMYVSDNLVKRANVPLLDLWHLYDPAEMKVAPYYGSLHATSKKTFGPVVQEAPERFACDAVANTQIAMGLLQAAPANKSTISSLPADSMLEAPRVAAGPGNVSKLTPLGGKPNPPVLLDGFKNPIILVPSSGIRVSITDPNNPGQATLRIIKAPDNRPFWASAGPDGFFTDPDETKTGPNLKPYGEDNIYSFEH
jgi:hypothetical protein